MTKTASFRLGDKTMTGRLVTENTKTIWAMVDGKVAGYYRVIKRHKRKHNCVIT